MSILDVGAGPGTITADLAERIAPGEVTVTEIDEQALGLSRAEFERRGLPVAPQRVNFCVEDVHALSFDDDQFDVVHAHQVLQHVADPVLALRELSRVCRRGGIIAVRDSDYHGFTWYPADPSLDAWMELYQTAARRNGGEPDAGRRLLAWAHAAGLSDVTASASVWCHANETDRDYWGGMWADRMLNSALAEQAIADNLASRGELQRISEAWQRWAAHPDGWISIVHGEILARPD